MLDTTANTAASPRSVNKLTSARSFKLCSWLQKLHEAGALTPTMTHSSLAVNAAAELQFPVTQHNIAGAFDALELKLPEAPVAADVALQRRVTKLENIVKMLCEHLEIPCVL